MDEKPKIRQIEALPVDTPQGRIVVLRDPFGFSPAMLQVSQHAFYIISLLDGTRDIRDVQAIFMRQFGQLVSSDDIEGLVEQLDSCHFLDNERFAELREEIVSQFLESPTRAASHAGTAYPGGKADLAKELDGLFDGKAAEPRGTADTARGLVVPHIDLGRGGECYASGYAELASKSQADVYVVLGTAHCSMNKPYSLTIKDFETPLGIVPTEREFGEELLAKCPWLAEDEFEHRAEHSVEFQALFLQYLFGGRRDFRIVPVLCGAFHREGPDIAEPGRNPHVAEFVSALTEAVSKRASSVCIIAGADLSHVGRRFGDELPLNDQFLRYLEERDLATLDFVLKGDAEGFYRDVVRDGDKRKICGLPNIYTMLAVLGQGAGSLVKYMQALDNETDSVVTFASVLIE
jgi:AmmeMemoRadiSam system protein B